MNDRVLVKCLGCSVILERRESSLNEHRRAFCNAKCLGKWLRPRYKGKRGWAWGLSKNTHEGIKRGGERHKQLWANPDWRENQVQAILQGAQVKPNRAEKKLNKLLQESYPGEYILNVSGKVLISGKIPDFVSPETLKLIELFGTYWHSRDGSRIDDLKRLSLFRELGYQTLVIWEDELNDEPVLLEKIAIFHSNNGFKPLRLKFCQKPN